MGTYAIFPLARFKPATDILSIIVRITASCSDSTGDGGTCPSTFTNDRARGGAP